MRGAVPLSHDRSTTGSAQPSFCATCGIYTRHRRRSNPPRYGVNAVCVHGVSPFKLAEVPLLDGRTHPNAAGGGAVRMGRTRWAVEHPFHSG